VLPDLDRPVVPGLDRVGAGGRVGLRVAARVGPGPGDGRGRGQGLQAAAGTAAALRPAGTDHNMADLAAVAVGPRLDRAVDADGAGDAGAERDEQEAADA